MIGSRAPLGVSTAASADHGDLIARLSPRHPLAFLRGGDGIVGLGEALRLEFSGPTRIVDAAAAWRAVASEAAITDPVGLPGTGLVAFGSFAFADGSADTSVLIVPQVILGRRSGVSWVTTIGPAPGPEAAGPAFGVDFAPGELSEDGYRAAVERALGAIEAQGVRKVVLARDLRGAIPADADLRHPLDALAAAYPDTFTFAVDGLIGSSPETLVRTEGGTVTARVLAGSAARGADAVSDASAASVLSASRKDVAEHAFALQSVMSALARRTDDLSASPHAFPLRLPNLWHLASDVTGTLTDGSSSLDLVAALHPTAAVAGSPTPAAVDLIAQLEPFDRGRYAGPVGWVDADGDGEWAVALRCARIADGTVTAYAGAGIVAGSDPARELAETALKFRPIVEAFAG